MLDVIFVILCDYQYDTTVLVCVRQELCDCWLMYT